MAAKKDSTPKKNTILLSLPDDIAKKLAEGVAAHKKATGIVLPRQQIVLGALRKAWGLTD
jgi:hypothetical protein